MLSQTLSQPYLDSAPSAMELPAEDISTLGSPRSKPLFSVADDAMEEMLRVTLPLSFQMVLESMQGIDCEQSRFGSLLCRRLGYMQVVAGEWVGTPVNGAQRSVQCVVKCPPKPMLPDMTRVSIRHRLLSTDGRALLEREIATLDVPYGESFCLQERWIVATVGPNTCELIILAFVHFRSRVLLHAKIKFQALKKSRKVSAMVAELLSKASQPDDEDANEVVDDSAERSELQALQEKFAALLEEATHLKRHALQLERENKRLQTIASYARKGKRQLSSQLVALEEALEKERRDRVAMEEALTQAYSEALRKVVEQQEATETTNKRAGGSRVRQRGGR